MAQTFDCPHCSANYRALPTLVGRKVRCSSCKNVFQLQHTGVAIKVDVGGEQGTAARKKQGTAGQSAQSAQPLAKKEDAALERKPGAAAPAASAPAAKKAVGEKPTRPQTRAIRRKTQRIQNMRSSLQAAAEQALQQEEEPASRESERRSPVKKASGVGRAPKKITDSHRVTLTGAAEQEQQARRFMLFGCSGFLVLCLLLWFVMSGTTPQRQALINFSKPIEEEYRLHPLRMDGYASRLWRPERLAGDRVPIVLNLEHATCAEVQRTEWPEIAAFLAKTIAEKVEYEHLPIWVEPEDIETIDAMWEPYENKNNIGGFYIALQKRDIAFYAMNEFSGLMLEQGFSKKVVYAVSMLLVPGLPSEQQRLLFDDEIPLTILLCEFDGTDGRRLMDTGTAYDVERLPEYHGLLLGFTGLANRPGEYWRILDIRLRQDMPYFYELAENPLLKYASAKTDALRGKIAAADEFPEPVEDEDISGDEPTDSFEDTR